MSLSPNNKALASDFVSLKARVKTEMLRRNKSGSLAAYGSSSYDFTVNPEANKNMLSDQANKIIEPMNAIAPSGFSTVSAGSEVEAFDQLEAKLAVYEQEPMKYGAYSSCASGCSGLCSSGCWNSCSGCTGCSGCGGACSIGCGSGCAGECSGCGSGCNAGCAPTCAGGCWNDGCTSNCTAACRMDCTGGCGGGCGTSCRRGCSASCSPSCANGPGIN